MFKTFFIFLFLFNHCIASNITNITNSSNITLAPTTIAPTTSPTPTNLNVTEVIEIKKRSDTPMSTAVIATLVVSVFFIILSIVYFCYHHCLNDIYELSFHGIVDTIQEREERDEDITYEVYR